MSWGLGTSALTLISHMLVLNTFVFWKACVFMMFPPTSTDTICQKLYLQPPLSQINANAVQHSVYTAH